MPQFLSDEHGPFGRNLQPTAAIRRAVRASGSAVPIVCTGGIHNFEMAEQALAEGVCDIIGAARQSLADPDWFRKLLLGLGGEVRVCQYTNYCEGLDQKHKPVTCQLWDRQGREEPGVKRSTDGRRLTAPIWRRGAVDDKPQATSTREAPPETGYTDATSDRERAKVPKAPNTPMAIDRNGR
jgi:tRNA-dihydrouridine synthase